MAPIASGTLPPSTLIHSFVNWKSLLAIAVGVFVSWLGGRGVALMGSQPQLVARAAGGYRAGRAALFRGVGRAAYRRRYYFAFIGRLSQTGVVAARRFP